MKIPNKEVFEPSNESLRKWLETRKPTLNVGGVNMPSFFSDTGNSSDFGWFCVAFVGELLGLITTLYGGVKSGGIFMIIAILSILMFIFLDFFFAKKLHRKKADLCIVRTKILLLEEEDIQTRSNLESQLTKGKFVDFLIQFGIILISIVKIIGILALGVFNNLILYLPFAVIYLIVAYVHIKHTWYCWVYWETQRHIDKEYKLFYQKMGFNARDIDEVVITPTALRKFPIKHFPHEIIEEKDTEEPLDYIIKAKGVLTDDDILALIAGQDANNKIALFKKCRNLQLENYQLEVQKD